MALTTPDMKSCTPKKKCLSGPNEGLAYTPGSECDQGYEFNEETCDCEAAWTSMLYKITGLQTFYRYCCNSEPQQSCSGCTGELTPGYPITPDDIFQEEYIILTLEEWNTRYSTGFQGGVCNTYETFANLASTKTWRGPGLRWIGSSPDSYNGTCNPEATATSWSCVGRCDGNLSISVIDGRETFEYFD